LGSLISSKRSGKFVTISDILSLSYALKHWQNQLVLDKLLLDTHGVLLSDCLFAHRKDTGDYPLARTPSVRSDRSYFSLRM
jgi:hypothetical protein